MHVWLSRNSSATQGPRTQGPPSTAAHPNHPTISVVSCLQELFTMKFTKIRH